ncbi:MAG: efflux RND transporter periplasmic adaptor subunit, partial [Bacteroidetes bacterium]
GEDYKYIKKILGYFLCLTLLITCKDKNGHEGHGTENEDYYTCPMHSSVTSDRPGVCPVCGMDLVKKSNGSGIADEAGNHENMLHINEYQQRLANIKTDTARIKTMALYNTVTGTVVPDETEINTISARAAGRIEKLFIRNPGEKIEKGVPLIQLYSEQLLADENDYLNTLKNREKFGTQEKRINEFIEAARQKLVLWGLTDTQILTLEKSNEVSPFITFYSPVSGYITQLKVREGQYVNEGDILAEVSGLETVWVEAQFYQDEYLLVKNSPQISVAFEAFPNEEYTGEIVFYNPSIQQNSKINLVHIRINNPKEKLKPEMMGYVQVKQSEVKTLTVPKSAILSEKMRTIWVQIQPGMFELRMVQTGIENKHEVEITEGIKEGEIIVVSGVYLLNSEFILKKGNAIKHQH